VHVLLAANLASGVPAIEDGPLANYLDRPAPAQFTGKAGAKFSGKASAPPSFAGSSA
jgi:hypothetical protein